MTRAEFNGEIRNSYIWDRLINFCRAYDYDEYVESIYSNEARDEIIYSDLQRSVRDGESWVDIRDMLNSYSDDYYEYWTDDGWGDWRPADQSTFDEIVDSLYDTLCEDGFF